MATAYQRLWSEISACDRCTRDSRIDPQTREHWRAIAFLPLPGFGPDPAGLAVRYLLVGMEPSLHPSKKKTRAYFEQRIRSGKAHNFGSDLHIRYAARHWLVNDDEAFVMTDLGKCMMPVEGADETRPWRYANCSPWLGREIDLFKDTLHAIIPMGERAREWCERLRQPWWPPITKAIVHPGYRFGTTKFKASQVEFDGVPTDAEFAAFAQGCGLTKYKRLTAPRRALLARWKVQFRNSRAALDA